MNKPYMKIFEMTTFISSIYHNSDTKFISNNKLKSIAVYKSIFDIREVYENTSI